MWASKPYSRRTHRKKKKIPSRFREPNTIIWIYNHSSYFNVNPNSAVCVCRALCASVYLLTGHSLSFSGGLSRCLHYPRFSFLTHQHCIYFSLHIASSSFARKCISKLNGNEGGLCTPLDTLG